MTVIHIVLFKFNPSLDKGAVMQVCDDMLALRHRCIHPTSQQPYIVTSSGGKDNSPEGLQAGLTHAFVVEFASLEDREYYLFHDPAHQAFIKSVEDNVDDVKVLDYEKGIF